MMVAGLDLAKALATPAPTEIDAYLEGDALPSIRAMVTQLLHGTSEAAKISAAVEVLDRGYGKPAVEIGGDAAMLPFMEAPSRSITTSAEVRAEARKYAPLAAEVLRKIRDGGASENARVSAGRALLARNLGTVGKARMPDEQRDAPVGKKEQANRAAELAGTGRYATPSAPRVVSGTAH